MTSKSRPLRRTWTSGGRFRMVFLTSRATSGVPSTEKRKGKPSNCSAKAKNCEPSSADQLMGALRQLLPEDFLSVTPLDTGVFESWSVYASEVRVTCIPKPNDSVRQYFDWLPEIDWDPE